MPNTLISGSSTRALEVAAALQDGDWPAPLCVDTVTALGAACDAMPPRSLDCYIQLPAEQGPQTTALTEASAMVADGAMARYAAAATVVPLLRDAATVVLVMGDGADRTLPGDLARAVNDLTRVLARALRNDHRATDLRVTLVAEQESPSEIASIARSPRDRPPTMDWYVDFEPELGSADWHCQVLSLLEKT
ncbi:MAG TPA: hypothetical protein VFE55_20145 [Acidimicrobiia bacterium]|nr:hypothetical protein [Acidimicrobiia bacterium]